MKDDFTVIPDDELTSVQRYALEHDLEPDDLEQCADCGCVMETHKVDTWREYFGEHGYSLPERPNQEPNRSEPLCKVHGDLHVAYLKQIEADRDSDRKRGERIAERYNIGNGSGWNNHTTARGIRDAIFEGQAPEVPEGHLVIGACIDREKPFGYRFAICRQIPAADLDDDASSDDADEWCSEIAGQPVERIDTYRVDSGTNNETRDVLAWLNNQL